MIIGMHAPIYRGSGHALAIGRNGPPPTPAQPPAPPDTAARGWPPQLSRQRLPTPPRGAGPHSSAASVSRTPPRGGGPPQLNRQASPTPPTRADGPHRPDRSTSLDSPAFALTSIGSF